MILHISRTCGARGSNDRGLISCVLNLLIIHLSLSLKINIYINFNKCFDKFIISAYYSFID